MFCTNYLPMRDIFSDIVRDADSQFVLSGAISRSEFFAKHVVYMKVWCEKYSICPQRELCVDPKK
jgi:hypothetical protein